MKTDQTIHMHIGSVLSFVGEWAKTIGNFYLDIVTIDGDSLYLAWVFSSY